ncbi:MAG: CPBP family glutamic-type intramembrane protease [Candidatus Omnitrophota bacterium]
MDLRFFQDYFLHIIKNMVGMIFLIALSFVIYLDADALKRQEETVYDQTLHACPITWAACMLLLSIFTTPIYLVRRSHFFRNFRQKDGPVYPQGLIPDLKILTDATGILLLFYLAILFASGLIFIWPEFSPWIKFPQELKILFFILPSAVLLALIYDVTRKHPYPGFLKSVDFAKKGQSFVELFTIPFVVGLILAVSSAFVMMSRKVIPSTPFTQTIDSIHSPTGLMMLLGLALLIAPLAEELIFRGYFFGVLEKFKGTSFAVTIIAIVFTLLHVGQYWGDWLAILIVAILGFSLSGLRAWTGSTIASTVTHYTYNFLVTLIPISMLIFSHTPYAQYLADYHKLNANQKEELLLQSIEQNPDIAPAYNDLAWLYARENKHLDKALRLADQALKKDPENRAFRDTKAEVLYRLKRYPEAIAIEEKLVLEDPSDFFVRKQLKKMQEEWHGQNTNQ